MNWTGGEKVNQLSQTAPALAVFNGTLFLAFVATDGTNNLYVCSWSPEDTAYVMPIGRFTFSQCGGSPVPQLLIFGHVNASDFLIPPQAFNQYNSLALNPLPAPGGLTLAVGYMDFPASESSASINIPVLRSTPNPGNPTPPPTKPNSVNLVFPQQFYDSFGLLEPAPFMNQPFFYQDGQRVYFVTELFDDTEDFGGIPGADNSDYGRLALASAPPPVANLSLVFPRAAGSLSVPSGSTALSRTATTTEQATFDGPNISSEPSPPSQVVFANFFHPFVCSLIKTLNRYGLSNLLNMVTQQLTNDGGVISGLQLGTSSSLAPSLTGGSLYAQGQLVTLSAPSPPPAPANQLSLLCYNAVQTGGTFYYDYNSVAPTYPGDAVIGLVETNSSSVIGVQSVDDNNQSFYFTIFNEVYQPTTIVDTDYPEEVVDFSFDGAYSIYNWELFFHIPLFVATQLSQNQQFQDAQTWFHYIFNPTINSDDPIPNKYWRFLPFYICSATDYIQGQVQNVFYPPPGTSIPSGFCGQDANSQIQAWTQNPFDPFVVAQMRTIAFRMNVVMAYIDNLIAWGDSLFAQNTRESINEATQIYVLANDILGPKPVQIPAQGTTQDYTYNDLTTLFSIDSLSNAQVLMENDFPYLTDNAVNGSNAIGPALSMSSSVPYFCFPPNSTLLGYWDTVADRLYKIRNCMNIQGVVEQLPLFAPPISPALLVAAAAEGISISSVLSNISASAPFYRFKVMVQKALELVGEVRSLGASLLSALEKNDAEALELLRATQETNLLQATVAMKQSAIDAANATLAGLQAGLQVTQAKQTYYQNLINAGLTTFENNQVSAPGTSTTVSDDEPGRRTTRIGAFTHPRLQPGSRRFWRITSRHRHLWRPPALDGCKFRKPGLRHDGSPILVSRHAQLDSRRLEPARPGLGVSTSNRQLGNHPDQ